MCWLDRRGQDLRDLTQADLGRWLTDGTSTRRAVRYFLQWAHGRGPAGDLNVPLPPRQETERLHAERDHIHRSTAASLTRPCLWTSGSGERASTPVPGATPPASRWLLSFLLAVLADLTGISVSTAGRWSQWAKRDWAAYVGQRKADDRRDHSDGQKLTNRTR
jgi:hypothetical protein